MIPREPGPATSPIIVVLLVEGGAVENANDACQQVVAQLGVGGGQHVGKTGIGLRDSIHSGVDGPACICLCGRVACRFFTSSVTTLRHLLTFKRNPGRIAICNFVIACQVASLDIDGPMFSLDIGARKVFADKSKRKQLHAA